jgi:hypothetical protein
MKAILLLLLLLCSCDRPGTAYISNQDLNFDDESAVLFVNKEYSFVLFYIDRDMNFISIDRSFTSADIKFTDKSGKVHTVDFQSKTFLVMTKNKVYTQSIPSNVKVENIYKAARNFSIKGPGDLEDYVMTKFKDYIKEPEETTPAP